MKKSKERTRLMWRVSLLVLLANICIASYSGNRLYAGGVSGSLEQMILDKKVSLNFKNKPIKDVLEEIKKLRLQAPIEIGTVLIENILGTGVNIIATKTVK